MLTVTTSAPSINIATLDAVKAGLGIAGTDEDATLPPLIAAASAAIAAYCNRVLREEEVEESFRSNHGELGLLLSRYPVSNVASVNEQGIALAEADFEVDQASGYISRLRNGADDWWAPGIVKVAYTAGYPVDGMPADLVQALIALVSQFRSAAGRDPLLRAEDVSGIERLEFFMPTAAALPGPVAALLDPYRRPAGA